MVDRVDVHCSLVSQKVLSLLPNPLPAAPPGGMIITDPGPGVFCDNAMEEIVLPLAPQPDVKQIEKWFMTGMQGLNEVGITAIGVAGMRAEDVRILETLVVKGETTIRISVMLECATRNEFCYDEVEELALVKEKDLEGGMMMLGGVKLFADGALGSFGAALLEPYSDNPETSGTMLINETELTNVVEKVSIVCYVKRYFAKKTSGSKLVFR
jgi:predicted amidohydrolase YtcJ